MNRVKFIFCYAMFCCRGRILDDYPLISCACTICFCMSQSGSVYGQPPIVIGFLQDYCLLTVVRFQQPYGWHQCLRDSVGDAGSNVSLNAVCSIPLNEM